MAQTQSQLQVNSTIVFAYANNLIGYAYATIIDPMYGKPEVYEATNIGGSNNNSYTIGNISFTATTPITKNGAACTIGDLSQDDIVYKVTR